MRRWRCRRERMKLAWSVFVLMAVAVPPVRADDGCPDLTGHYRVDGFGPVLGDALEALKLQSAGFTDSEVKISGDAAQSLSFWIKSGRSGAMASRPSLTLTRGAQYDCAAGAIVLRNSVESARKTDDGHLEGRSVVRLSRSGEGLGLSAEFHGGQRYTLYSYESARISVPKPGTGRTVIDGIRWPGIREPRPAKDYVPAPDSPAVADLRRQLQGVLGDVRLGGLEDRGGRVRASLNASRAEDVVAFEDRLHEAGLLYVTTQAPVWSNNQYYMEFLFGIAPGITARGWHPSVFRVQHEIDRLRSPMISVRGIKDADDGYIAELDVIGSESVDPLLQRLRTNTTMFRAIEVLDDVPQTDRRNLRVVRLRLKTSLG
ncbi:hypothetical protein [Tahibacter caeni]|uniref:hypothetical protein n=1 Tax=Tahibacter caeni TaxID=1453545 RepID=UPI00214957A0|nr:hypothetical protein [Tahibacter caeni]